MVYNEVMAVTAVVGLTEGRNDGQVLLKLDSCPKTCYLEDVIFKFYSTKGKIFRLRQPVSMCVTAHTTPDEVLANTAHAKT